MSTSIAATDRVRPVTLITVKRRDPALFGGGHEGDEPDKYGHWWFEIGDPFDDTSESYGWWPSRRVTPLETLTGVPGSLNGVDAFDGTDFRNPPPRDPHHGRRAPRSFHPVVAASDPRSDEEIAECLRGFARQYAGEWRWTFGAGQHCHSFQRAALAHCELSDPQE